MRKLTLEEIQSDARRRGGRCLSEVYVGSLEIMEWECAEGHRWQATGHSVRQDHWCKRCADARLRFPARHAAEIAEARGGRCLSPYSNSATRMQWSCARGHAFFATLTAVKRGTWCPTCKGKSPRGARQARSWVAAISVPLHAAEAEETPAAIVEPGN